MRNRKGNFKVGMRTEKSRLRRSLLSLQELMRRVRYDRIGDQVGEINAALRGHYAYYGVAGNIRALFKVYRAVERYWHRMLRSRSRAASRLTWDTFNQIKKRSPLLRPKLRLPYPGAASTRGAVNQLPKSVVREIRTRRFVGTGGGRPPPVTRCEGGNIRAYSVEGWAP